ncbi:MAG: lipoyl synthase [Pseudomonadota bacterium]
MTVEIPVQTNPAAGKPRGKVAGVPLRGIDKVRQERIPVRVAGQKPLPKPDWIRIRLPGASQAEKVRALMRQQRLHTVCEEAACPNLPECFGKGTATFMILGDVCTRRCAFCDVGFGKPLAPDAEEPQHLADAVKVMGLKYVVITSVNRDDLKDGSAAHYASCINAIRRQTPEVKIEILTPDFRNREVKAIQTLKETPPDVFNHNIETVPRLYRNVRPGADYQGSLKLLENIREALVSVPAKSGLMLGLGETREEVRKVMADLRDHNVDMLTIGQYLAPSAHHYPVQRYVNPSEFDELREYGYSLGFAHVASGPLVRSSYHADVQAEAAIESMTD